MYFLLYIWTEYLKRWKRLPHSIGIILWTGGGLITRFRYMFLISWASGKFTVIWGNYVGYIKRETAFEGRSGFGLKRLLTGSAFGSITISRMKADKSHAPNFSDRFVTSSRSSMVTSSTCWIRFPVMMGRAFHYREGCRLAVTTLLRGMTTWVDVSIP